MDQAHLDARVAMKAAGRSWKSSNRCGPKPNPRLRRGTRELRQLVAVEGQAEYLLLVAVEGRDDS